MRKRASRQQKEDARFTGESNWVNAAETIVPLLRLCQSMSAAERNDAVVAVHALCMNPRNTVQLLPTDTFERVLDLCLDQRRTIRRHASGAAFCFCKAVCNSNRDLQASNRQAVHQHALQILIDVLRNVEEDREVQQHAVAGLMQLCQCRSHRKPATDMGIIAVLFAKIVDDVGDIRLRRDAIECLRSLADTEERRQKMLRHGVLACLLVCVMMSMSCSRNDIIFCPNHLSFCLCAGIRYRRSPSAGLVHGTTMAC